MSIADAARLRRLTAGGVATAVAAVLAGCGGGGEGASASKETTAAVSAQQPASVEAAEAAVHDKVSAMLTTSNETYSEDVQVVTVGGAVCRPFSDFQLDCTQKMQGEGEDSDWTGTSRWRATIDPRSGKATAEEHGGRRLADQLGINQSCLDDGVAC